MQIDCIGIVILGAKINRKFCFLKKIIMDISIRELIKEDFGVDLPISGKGNSIDNPIVIHSGETNDYTGVEYAVLKYLGIGRRIKWKIIRQELLSHNGRMIDKIKIETVQTTETQIITQIENYYFDITEFYDQATNENMAFDEEATLEQIKNRLLELERKNDDNKKAMALLRKGKLCKSEYLNKFLDMLFEDESFTLFEDMYNHKKKPAMDVLRIIGEKLRQENQ